MLTAQPQPMSTAPEDEDLPLLLYCPNEGGWHTGTWFRGKWLAAFDKSVVLQPEYWLSVPPDPPPSRDRQDTGGR